MKFIWKNLGTRIWLIVTAIVVVLAIVITVLLTSVPIITNSVSLVLGGERANITEDYRDSLYDREFDSKDKALEAAEDFVVDVEREGIILLKNENDALPLAQSAPKVSVFGKNSVNPVYTGSGSASSSSSNTQDIYAGLDEAGIEYNEALKTFYESSSRSGSGRESNPSMTSGERIAGFATGETPISSYDSTVESSYDDYDDAAIVVISRIGGEGWDLPRTMATDFTYSTAVDGASSPTDHYLELDANEKDLIEYVEGKFSTVIVVLNSGTTMEMGDLQDDENIDAILWMGFPGGTGALALGEVLTGETVPSGHTTDTWVRDFTQDPSWYNTGVYSAEYGNRYIYDGSTTNYAFVNYEEGIYVGYRYWETRGYEEEQENSKSTWYDDNVVYPFGYGLSYTSFDWDVSFEKSSGTAVAQDDAIDVTVKVTNTGSYAGKEVVQLYYTAPYEEGGIEKAHVVLGDFAKTGLIEAGGSETVTLSIDVSDMKSYDYADANGNGFAGYELEAGDYVIKVGSDSHTVAATATYSVGTDVQLETIENAQGEDAVVENQFDDVSAGIYGTTTYEDYSSRDDFEGTIPSAYLDDSERTLTDDLKDLFDSISTKNKYTSTAYASDEGQPWQVTGDAPSTTTVNSGLSLKDMLYDEDGDYVGSVSFDDSRWDTLLQEITVDEMKSLINYGAFQTIAVSGVDGVVNKPATNDSDGPSGFTNFLSESVFYDTCTYQGECVMGATWNVDLAYRMGEMIGEEGLAGNEDGDGLPYSGWYAPAMNIHRSQFAGRNWEYYSEDGLLSGKLAAQTVQGAKTKGVYCYLKHFALNDQETDREYYGIFVWANEQAMREVYLTPFEICVKEGGANAMMSSFNRIGTTWTGGSYALLTEVLRNEWGFEGMVITDYSTNRYTYIDLMIRAGGDLFLTQDEKSFYMEDDATQITNYRRATKNILYVVANSNIMSIEVDGYKWPLWQEVMTYIDIGLGVVLVVWGVAIILVTAKKKKTAP